MKINLLSLAPAAVSSAAVDDSSTLLAVATQSTTAMNLMNAVGHRNVSAMQALVQEIVEESVNEPGWKFDSDIQDALEAIRDMFVKSIQAALNDQHKADQEHFNCFTQDCFGDCIKAFDEGREKCDSQTETCDAAAETHVQCRNSVHEKYTAMAKACGALHCWSIPDPPCNPEDCLCPDVSNCHRKGASENCAANIGDCTGKMGDWLASQTARYTAAFAEWRDLHASCQQLYHEFLEVDMQCDFKQKEFESCLCKQNQCLDIVVNVDYQQCETTCWARYEEIVKEKECLEKDRKIDWSATKKIECYLDVLLHNYTKNELLSKCGTEDCINKAREEDYKNCATVCVNIDHDGRWPEVEGYDKVQGTISISGHSKREGRNEFHLGDGEYKCDANGDAIVFTKHRGGGVSRADEERCTEHLDIDYQLPRCIDPPPPPPPICDAAFHKKYYSDFDGTSKISTNWCPDEGDCQQDGGVAKCFSDETLQTSNDAVTLSTITVKEHSNAWAFNRCECTECVRSHPVFTPRPDGRQCGMGAHTISPDGGAKTEWTNVCLSSRGDKPATIEVDQDLCVSSITITHKEGRVSCRRAASGDSNWGCDGNSMGLVLADGAQVTAPVFDSTAGMTPHYSHHAHWYRMDGVSKNSEAMTWTFHQPAIFESKEYKLWYNEDLTGGTEGDNRGQACYDVAMTTADKCTALAPLQFRNVCTSARGNAHGSIELPADTCVTEIAIHHINGWVSCVGAHHTGHRSNFGCAENLVGLVWTRSGSNEVIMPKAGQVQGIKRTSHGHAHWYHMDGVSKNTRTLSMKMLGGRAMKVSGGLNLWYNEDLSGGTEGDNSGRACYEVAVHRARDC